MSGLRLPIITAAILDQWESSAEVDAAADKSWTAHPLAVIAVVRLARTALGLPMTLDVDRLARALALRVDGKVLLGSVDIEWAQRVADHYAEDNRG